MKFAPEQYRPLNPQLWVQRTLQDLVAQLVGQRIGDLEVWGSIPDTGHE